MAEENKFEFYLNQQGPRGRQGVKGDDGFSPVISVASQTSTEYILQITNSDGTFETPNLLPAILDAGGTVLQFDRENRQYYLGDLPTATEDTLGLVKKATEDEINTLAETNNVISPLDVYTIAGNIIKPDSSNVHITVDPESKQIKISVDAPEEYDLPVAAVGVLGGIMPDNQTIMVDADGTAHANLDEIGNELNALANRVNNLDDDVIALDGMLMEAQSDILALNDEMTDVHNTTANLDTRVTELEQKEIPDGVYTNTNLTGGSNVSFRKVGDVTYIDAEGGGAETPIATTEVAGKVKPDGTSIVVEEDGTIHATGGGGSVEPDNVTIHFDDAGKLGTTVDINDTQNRVEDLEEKVEDLQLYKFPNATIIGDPTINNGQVSGFTANDYMQFPFILDLHNKAFQIDFCFTTGNDVATQQNILDSEFGLALAIKDGHGLMAISSNGTSWDIGSIAGTATIAPNTTYYARLSWNGMLYRTYISTDGSEYTQDMQLTSNLRPFPRTIFIGGCSGSLIGHTPHPFGGIINMNKASMLVSGQLIWQGMDDVGLATRADINLDNITETGKQVIRDLASEVAPATPIATTSTVGTVKPDGDSITIDEDGTIHAQGGGGTSGYTKDETDALLADKQDKFETEKPLQINIDRIQSAIGWTIDRSTNTVTAGMAGLDGNNRFYTNDDLSSDGKAFKPRSVVYYPINNKITFRPEGSSSYIVAGVLRPDGYFEPRFKFSDPNESSSKLSTKPMLKLTVTGKTSNYVTYSTTQVACSVTSGTTSSVAGTTPVRVSCDQLVRDDNIIKITSLVCNKSTGSRTNYASYSYIVPSEHLDSFNECNTLAVFSSSSTQKIANNVRGGVFETTEDVDFADYISASATEKDGILSSLVARMPEDDIVTKTLALGIDNDTLKVNSQGQLYADGVGDVQEALELLNGGETTLLSSKVDLPTATAASFPASNKMVHLTLGASGEKYTAPADGWYNLGKFSGAAGEMITVSNSTASLVSRQYSTAANQNMWLYILVKRGQNCQIDYTLSGQTYDFRFHYAEGCKDEV